MSAHPTVKRRYTYKNKWCQQNLGIFCYFPTNLHPDLIYAFPPALQNLQNSPAVEIRSSFARLLGLPCHSRSGDLSGDLSRSRKSGSLRVPSPDERADSIRFVFICTRKQTGKPAGTNFPIYQNPHHLLDHMVPHSKLRCSFSDCYLSVFSDELVDFLLVALSCSSSLSTTARLIGDVDVSVLKMFHSISDTASTHADISIQTTKSLVDDSCRLSLFHKFSDSMLMKHVGDSHFLSVRDENVRRAHALILRSSWRGKMPLMVL
jgi:hypothetical protein